METDAFEFYLAIDGWHFDGVRGVFYFGLEVDDFEDSHPGGHCSLELAVLHGQVADRLEESLNPHGECDHHAPVQSAIQHHRSTQDHDYAHRDAGQSLHDRLEAS